MARVQSFEPVIGHCPPRVLILGSMPGTASLEAVQYYAHPRNAFWPIMAALFDFDFELDYSLRIEAISHHPVILWDTLQACHRPGSLDSRIDVRTAQANNFKSLLQRFPDIRVIAFNGATSARFFRKLVLPGLPSGSGLDLLQLPSTSPAHAGMSFDEKLQAWRQLLEYID